jgi:hypothetical protein
VRAGNEGDKCERTEQERRDFCFGDRYGNDLQRRAHCPFGARKCTACSAFNTHGMLVMIPVDLFVSLVERIYPKLDTYASYLWHTPLGIT